MRGVIIAGGEPPAACDIEDHVQPGDLIVCADSGYDAAVQSGLTPSVLIGDMDSVSHIPQGVEIIRASRAKDQTDTQLCVDYLAEKGVLSAVLLGALGGRIDHMWANMLLLSYAQKKGVTMKIVSAPYELFLIRDTAEIPGEAGDILSLFPLHSRVLGIETDGLVYPLKNETLYQEAPRGISNVFSQENASVRVRKGVLLAIHIKAGGEIKW